MSHSFVFTSFLCSWNQKSLYQGFQLLQNEITLRLDLRSVLRQQITKYKTQAKVTSTPEMAYLVFNFSKIDGLSHQCDRHQLSVERQFSVDHCVSPCLSNKTITVFFFWCVFQDVYKLSWNINIVSLSRTKSRCAHSLAHKR